MDSARQGGSRRADSSPCPVKTGIQEALPKTVLPRQAECGRYQPVIAAKAAIQRASIGHRLSLYAGCTLDTTLPVDATGLDSGLRRNDIGRGPLQVGRSEEHTSELQSRLHLVCRLLLVKKHKQAIFLFASPRKVERVLHLQSTTGA